MDEIQSQFHMGFNRHYLKILGFLIFKYFQIMLSAYLYIQIDL